MYDFLEYIYHLNSNSKEGFQEDNKAFSLTIGAFYKSGL